MWNYFGSRRPSHAIFNWHRCVAPAIEAERIRVRKRIALNVGVIVDPSLLANRIFRNKAFEDWVVVASPVVKEARGVILTPSVLTEVG
jgi:hypothetical protein